MAVVPLAQAPEPVLLDRVKVGGIFPTGVYDLSIEAQRNLFTDELAYKIKGYVLSEHLASDTVEQSKNVPATWWDHLKDDARSWAWNKPCRILTRRWTNRYPPRFKTLTLTATWTRRATRPQSKIPVRDKQLGPVVYQEDVDTALTWED